MLTYCKDYNHENGIRVSVSEERGNMSWAVLDRNSGEIIQECKRGEYLFPGLTDAQIEEARQTISGFVPAPYTDVYIRFGRLPADGRSTNYVTGKKESGVSCYEAEWDLINSVYRRSGSGYDGAAINYLIKGAPVYLIKGEAAGTGSDGEPVISDAEIVAELVFDSSADGYRIK